MSKAPQFIASAPLVVGVFALVVGGLFLLERADAQARDTIRKHHLQDIEDSLYFAYNIHGTYPPYEVDHWCGYLNESELSPARVQIEESLRAQHEKYANPEKPFPTDPLFAEKKYDYVYWKRSPAVFELYAKLEMDPNGTRQPKECGDADVTTFDYGLTSELRRGPRASELLLN